MRKLLLSLFLLGSSLMCAQALVLKQFTKDSDKFFEEMHTFITTSMPDEGEVLMAEFEAAWNTTPMELKKEEKFYKNVNEIFKKRLEKLGLTNTFAYSATTRKFNLDQKDDIYDMCNLMLSKRMKAMPDFQNYLTSLLGFIITDQSEMSFSAWNSTLKKLMGGNLRGFGNFINTTNNLFLYGSIYVSPGVRWTGTSKSFTFDYDSLPKVVFPEKMTLFCVSKRDTSYIYETKGVYYPSSLTFFGAGGTVTWERVGVPRKVSYAMLNKYKINLRFSKYSADSVTYFNSKYFATAQKGRLEERIQADVDSSSSSFPSFVSYDKSIKISNISKDVDFDGGFAIKGSRFLAQGTAENRAKLIFKYQNKPTMELSAEYFSITDSTMVSSDASVVIRVKNDSIYHPSLQFKYIKSVKLITLYRDKKTGLSKSPYYDTYHDIDIDVEWLRWRVDTPAIVMSAIIGSSTHEMDLESSNFYDEGRFISLQGISDAHPLYQMKMFVDKRNNKQRDFNISDYVSYVHLDENDVKNQLIVLANFGFIDIDFNAGRVVVKDKLYHYLYAKSKKEDYDNISIHSDIADKPNATLLLTDSCDMIVRGVKKVMLSEGRKVYFQPMYGEVVLHKNRDMTFGGAIKSGMFEFFGKQFEFKYDEFKIEVINADSLRMFAPTIEQTVEGKVQMKRVESTIEKSYGRIFIDKPFNKSGIKIDSFPSYPIYVSDSISKVFFDKRNEQGKAYARSKVYFTIKPFIIDSLNTLDRNSISFDGTFTSGGIFPDFEETIRVQNDHSLGFKHPAPKDGLPIYGGKAMYFMDIALSNRGIRGDGKLDYITSTTYSDDFVFFVDAVNAIAKTFDVKERKDGVEYPSAAGTNLKFHFEPYKDKLWAGVITNPIDMFGTQAKLKGTMIYGAEKMGGFGVVAFENAELASKDFDFKNRKFKADTSDFKLKAAQGSEQDGSIAFATKNVKSTIDFDKREGEFIANGGASFVDFPVNQYVCYMDQFKWFMDKFVLELSTSKGEAKAADGADGSSDLDLSGSEFISTHPKQDSLKFISPKANFDIKNYIIKAHEVKYINVADARIFPVDGEVMVEKAAKMKSFEHAKIIANNLTQYHTILEAEVAIHAKRDYNAKGDYEYVDAEGGRQKIHFANIHVDSTYQTIASGDIAEAQLFKLSPQFMYKGPASIAANRKGIFFAGGAKLVHKCKQQTPWISFEGEIDPASVQIPVDTITKVFGDPNGRLLSGLAIAPDSIGVYSTLMSPKKAFTDDVIICGKGFLMFDAETKEYRISNKDKLRERNFPGTYVAMNTSTCAVETEGKMTMAFKLGQVKMQVAGTGFFDPNADTSKFDAMMTMDFLLDDGMWKHIMNNIEGNPKLSPVNNNRTAYERALRDLVGKEKGDKLISELALYGAFKRFPDELKHSFVFNHLNLVWDKEKSAFVSQGMIGIGSMDNHQLNKYVKGYVMIERKKLKEEIYVYLEIDDKTWYFFNYSAGVMSVLSSHQDFMAIMAAIKPDKKEVKGGKDKDDYSYMEATERRMRIFVSRMRGE